MIRRPPRSTQSRSSAASDVYKRQLDRDVGARAAVHLATDHPFGVLHRDAPLGLLDEGDQADHEHDHECDDDELGRAVLATGDRPHGGREGRRDLREDQQRHAVADAAFTDQLTEPHDHRGSRGHRDDHDQDDHDAPVRDDLDLSLIHISEPTRLGMISYAVFCLKKKKKKTQKKRTNKTTQKKNKKKKKKQKKK